MTRGKPKWSNKRYGREWFKGQCPFNPLGTEHAYAGFGGMMCVWCGKVKKGFTLPKALRAPEVVAV